MITPAEAAEAYVDFKTQLLEKMALAETGKIKRGLLNHVKELKKCL